MPAARAGTITTGDAMRDRYGASEQDDRRSGLERGLERAIAYLRTRTADHWLMFTAGLVIGLILG